MQIETRDFGRAEINEKDIITFVKPILGFEEYTRFVMLIDDEITGFAWLQSVEEKELCFIIVILLRVALLSVFLVHLQNLL